METFQHLESKICACCLSRLDKVPKRDIRRVNECDLVNNLNTFRPDILTKKRKEIDQNEVKLGDWICGRCMSYAKKFYQNLTTFIKPPTSPLLINCIIIFEFNCIFNS